MSELTSNDALLNNDQEGQNGQPPGADKETPNVIRVPIGETWCEVAKSETDERWYWCLWGGHGRAMATSAGGYRNREDCIDAFKQVAAAAQDEATKIAVAYLPKQKSRKPKL